MYAMNESGEESFYQYDTKDETYQRYLESLVIAGQHTAVNTFPGLVHTARHTMGVSNTRSR